MKNPDIPIEEKISEIMERFFRIFRTMQWDIVKKYKISPIQLKFLIYLKNKQKKLCTVLNISREFSLRPPTVSDAIASLVKKGYVLKEKNSQDKRNIYLKITDKGQDLEKKIRGWNEYFIKSIKMLPSGEKEKLYDLLLNTLINLQKLGFLPQLQFCLNCKHFEKIDAENEYYFCNLTKNKMKLNEIKYNCEFYNGEGDIFNE